MRPVNKGESPYKAIKKYADALPYLETAIGLYCSYCEFPIPHVPEVEHVSSKSKGGSLTDWNNLLLGCKYCNTRKKDKVLPEDANEYMWPDQDNTSLAYSYEGGIPSVNVFGLNSVDPTGAKLAKAERLFKLVELDNQPKLGVKDRRFHQRNKVYEIALESLDDWRAIKDNTSDVVDVIKKQIICNAQANGFFSIWMTVFSDEPVMLKALIEAFPGTNKDYFDEIGHPKFI